MLPFGGSRKGSSGWRLNDAGKTHYDNNAHPLLVQGAINNVFTVPQNKTTPYNTRLWYHSRSTALTHWLSVHFITCSELFFLHSEVLIILHKCFLNKVGYNLCWRWCSKAAGVTVPEPTLVLTDGQWCQIRSSRTLFGTETQFAEGFSKGQQVCCTVCLPQRLRSLTPSSKQPALIPL